MTIGITGGIGSGKSTIARELAQRGHAVYDCDAEAKRLIGEDAGVQAAIIALLGEEAFADGRYNTAYVARRVFAEPDRLAALNRIVHPAVKEDILRRRKDSAETVLWVESAILFEAGLDALCDRIVIVEAPEDIRIARTIARDYHGDASPAHIDTVRARIQAQRVHYPTDDAIRLCNDGAVPVPELTDRLIGLLHL